MELEGKVALVTGAGSGIGRATAANFAEQGAQVVATDIAADRLAELGSAFATVQGDISVREDAERAVRTTIERFGRIDVLANVAGIADRLTPLADTDDDEWTRVLGVDLNGPMYTCRAALPEMVRQGSGAIVNVSSIAGFLGGRAGAAYSAAKHGVIGLTRSIAVFYGRDGIRCNAVCPGLTDTNIVPDPSTLHPRGLEIVMSVVGSAPVAARPEEMASVISFLASDAASYVNGMVMTADGGWTAA